MQQIVSLESGLHPVSPDATQCPQWGLLRTGKAIKKPRHIGTRFAQHYFCPAPARDGVLAARNARSRRFGSVPNTQSQRGEVTPNVRFQLSK
jgi:hypothetical protein